MKPWINELLDAARRMRFTGTLELNMNQGGIASAKLKGEKVLTEPDIVSGTPETLYGWFGKWNSTTE